MKRLKRKIVVVLTLVLFFASGKIVTAKEAVPANFVKIHQAAEENFGVDWRFLAAINKAETNFSQHPRTYKPHKEGSLWIVGTMQIGYDAGGKWRPVLLSYPEAIKQAREWEAANNVPHYHVPPCLNPKMVACDDVVSVFVAAAYLQSLGVQKGASLDQLKVAAGHYNGGPHWRKTSAVCYASRVVRQYQQYCQIYPELPKAEEVEEKEKTQKEKKDLSEPKESQRKEVNEMSSFTGLLPAAKVSPAMIYIGLAILSLIAVILINRKNSVILLVLTAVPVAIAKAGWFVLVKTIVVFGKSQFPALVILYVSAKSDLSEAWKMFKIKRKYKKLSKQEARKQNRLEARRGTTEEATV